MTTASSEGAALVRSARPGDLPALLALLLDDDIAAEREAAAEGPGYEAAFDEILADPNQDLLVAERDGDVTGMLQLTFIRGLTSRGGCRALVESVRVAATERGRGIGTALVEAAVEAARGRGCYLVQLTTDRRRERALSFYERLGFRDTHRGMKLRLSGPHHPPDADRSVR
jgi:GNAT superfamily N-acetyltransferase